MELPKLSGYRQDGRRYDVRAASGVQDIKVPNIIELNQMDATFETGDNNRDGGFGLGRELDQRRLAPSDEPGPLAGFFSSLRIEQRDEARDRGGPDSCADVEGHG